jgi:hypothetical protein
VGVVPAEVEVREAEDEDAEDELREADDEAEVLELGPLLLEPGVVVPEKVVPMSPKRMLEYVTDAFGYWASTSEGLPEVTGHGPRETPGAEGSLSAGKVESSQSICDE